MSTHDVIEFDESLALAGLEHMHQLGDKYALVKAAAVCHDEGAAFPVWLVQAIGEAMSDLHAATFTEEASPSAAQSSNRAKTRFIAARGKAQSALGLAASGVDIVQTHIAMQRDMDLTQEIVLLCGYSVKRRKFTGIGEAIEAVSNRKHVALGTESLRRAWKHHSAFFQRIYDNLGRDFPEDVGGLPTALKRRKAASAQIRRQRAR